MRMPRIRGGVLALAAIVLFAGLLAAETPAESPRLDFSAVRRSERTIDGRIERYNTESPMEVIGATRGVYLAGTGLLFSIEVSLSPAVGISPFFTCPGRMLPSPPAIMIGLWYPRTAPFTSCSKVRK